MVERTAQLDSIFGSLSDATRRDILTRVAEQELSISEVAAAYDLTFAAVSKHLKVLEDAGLVVKTRRGKERYVQLAPLALKGASHYLEHYRALWEGRLDSLDAHLKTVTKKTY